jgi:DNA-binding Lrp family transcriptional regulator
MAIFDVLDRKLLAHLDENARIPLIDLSKYLREGTDRISYRMERLFDAGLLKGFSAVIDPFSLGLIGYKCYVKLENRPTLRRKFLNALEKSNEVFWFSEGSGAYDIMFSVYTSSPQIYSEVERRLIAGIQSAVYQIEVLTVLHASLFAKKYLTKGLKNEKYIGRTAVRTHIDQKDAVILQHLSQNARISLTELSQHVSLAPSNIALRIQSLEKSKVIAGYRIEIDVSKIDMMSIKAMLHLRTYNHNTAQKFLLYAKTHPFITYYIEQLGNAQIEIELDVTDYRHYASIIDDIKQRFPTFIQRIETVVIDSERYRWNLKAPK